MTKAGVEEIFRNRWGVVVVFSVWGGGREWNLEDAFAKSMQKTPERVLSCVFFWKIPSQQKGLHWHGGSWRSGRSLFSWSNMIHCDVTWFNACVVLKHHERFLVKWQQKTVANKNRFFHRLCHGQAFEHQHCLDGLDALTVAWFEMGWSWDLSLSKIFGRKRKNLHLKLGVAKKIWGFPETTIYTNVKHDRFCRPVWAHSILCHDRRCLFWLENSGGGNPSLELSKTKCNVS